MGECVTLARDAYCTVHYVADRNYDIRRWYSADACVWVDLGCYHGTPRNLIELIKKTNIEQIKQVYLPLLEA